MAFEHQPNSGSLFKNDRKTKDTQPGWRGSGKINDVEYWISAWINTTKGGDKYISMKFDPKENPQYPTPEDNTYDDDIPF